jgi:hypothetical protein
MVCGGKFYDPAKAIFKACLSCFSKILEKGYESMVFFGKVLSQNLKLQDNLPM